MKNHKKITSNSNPFKSLFEVEVFLTKLSNIKTVISLRKNYKKILLKIRP